MIYINSDKLDKFKKLEINEEEIYLVLDFDRTITASNSEDSWDASRKNVRKRFWKRTIRAIY